MSVEIDGLVLGSSEAILRMYLENLRKTLTSKLKMAKTHEELIQVRALALVIEELEGSLSVDLSKLLKKGIK